MSAKPVLLAWLWLFSLSTRSEGDCSQIVQEGTLYLAASSEERGYYKAEDKYFNNAMTLHIEARLEKICELNGCGLARDYKTAEWNTPSITVARVPNGDRLEDDDFLLVRAWKYADEGRQNLGNFLWFVGHTLSCFTILGVMDYWEVFPHIAFIPPVFVVLSQGLTMISRPIERKWGKWNAPREISAEKGLQRIAKKQKVNKLRFDEKARVPHLIFTSIECHPPRFDLEIQTE
jgi:hypothetical protein